VFSFNHEVFLRSIILGGAMDFTLDWGSGSSTSLVASGSYEFAPGERLDQGSSLSITADAGSQAIKAIIVEVPGGYRDTDGDGMPDSAEIYYGFDLNDPLDASQDADGDGMLNLNEIWAGTHPQDANSILRMSSVRESQPGSVAVEWLSVSGRTYSVEYADSLKGSWQVLAGSDSVVATNTLCLIEDSGSATSRFYRVVVQPE
jgi:hypothetical protein